MPCPRPFQLGLRLLRWALPRDVRDDVTGDLIEVFQVRRETLGRIRAEYWFWVEAFSFTIRFLPDRVAERRHRWSGAGAWLDLKSGVRMLSKHPMPTLVGGLSIAVVVSLTSGAFEFVSQMTDPRLPYQDGDDIVVLVTRAGQSSRSERRVLHQFSAWRDELETVAELGAFRTDVFNIVDDSGDTWPVHAAEMTATAFGVPRVAPLLGRPLVADDESSASPPVTVIGYEVWQARFAGDPEILGRKVQMGGALRTVVGVMPRSFAFPRNQDIWIPFRWDAADFPRGGGPQISVVGRLSTGASISDAHLELAGLGKTAAARFPEVDATLTTTPIRYPGLRAEGLNSGMLLVFRSLLVLLLFVACANVGTLIYARSATRESELAVRQALGAGRGRIGWQLFSEALVLVGGAAILGLGMTALGLTVGEHYFVSFFPGLMPGYWSFSLAPSVILMTGVLTVVAAALAGALPAWRVTASERRGGLRHAASGGGAVDFGRTATALVMTQVALSVVAVEFAARSFSAFAWTEEEEGRFHHVGYLSVRVQSPEPALAEIGPGAPGVQGTSVYHESRRALAKLLQEEPEVLAVTFGDRLPGNEYSHRRVEVEGVAWTQEPEAQTRISIGYVDPSFFQVFDGPIVQGVGLGGEGGEGVVVNRAFAARFLEGEDPLGRRLRYADGGTEEGPWHEIVGVAPDLGMDPFRRVEVPGVYHPVEAERTSLRMAIRLASDPAAFVPRLRELAAVATPSLTLTDAQPLARIGGLWRTLRRTGVAAFSLVTAAALMLSISGIYALLSFLVTQRTREIGIRTALGAEPRSIVLRIFSRALLQIGVGVMAGAVLLLLGMHGRLMIEAPVRLLLLMVLTSVVGLAACVGPTWRALNIEPTEALKGQ